MNKLSTDLLEEFAQIYREHMDATRVQLMEIMHTEQFNPDEFKQFKAKDLEQRLRVAGIKLERS